MLDRTPKNIFIVFTTLFQVVKGNAIDFPDDRENFCVDFRWNNNFPKHGIFIRLRSSNNY